MSGMDWFAAVCLLIVGWTGYEYGAASEREKAARRKQAAADRAATRATGNVVRLDERRRA